MRPLGALDFVTVRLLQFDNCVVSGFATVEVNSVCGEVWSYKVAELVTAKLMRCVVAEVPRVARRASGGMSVFEVSPLLNH